MSDRFEPTGTVAEDVRRLAEAYIFASLDPATARTLAPLLPLGHNAHLVLGALRARCAPRGVVLAEADGACGRAPASNSVAAVPAAGRSGDAGPGCPAPTAHPAEIEAVRGA